MAGWYAGWYAFKGLPENIMGPSLLQAWLSSAVPVWRGDLGNKGPEPSGVLHLCLLRWSSPADEWRHLWMQTSLA